MSVIKTSSGNAKSIEFLEIARSGIFRAYADLNCAESLSLLAEHNLRPAAYQEILSRAYGTSRRAGRFRERIGGSSFHINGWGIDEFDGHCTFNRKGELAQMRSKPVRWEQDINHSVLVYPGQMPLILSAYKERFAGLKGHRFEIDGDIGPYVKVWTAMGVRDDGRLDGMLAGILRR